MKKYLALLTAFLTLTISHGQQITFQKVYGGTDYDGGYAIQQTSDGGYIIAGETNSNKSILLRINESGDTIWNKIFTNIQTGWAESVLQAVDGGFIVTGSTYSGGYSNISLIKTSANGILQWFKTYGGTRNDFGNTIKQTNDGGYILSGTTESLGAGYGDIYLVKIASDGNLSWTKTFGTTYSDEGRGIEQTSDGGYLATGWSGGALLIKTDSNGDTLWTKRYLGVGDLGWSIHQTTDGGYVIVGTTWDSSGANDMLLFKTDITGSTQWAKTYGQAGVNDESYSMQSTKDGGYILSGRFVYDNRDVGLLKTDKNGDTLWSKSFADVGTFGGDLGWCVQQTKDNGYIIAAEGNLSNGWGGSGDVYLIKTDSLGNSGCKEMHPQIVVANPTITVANSNIKVSSGGSTYSFTLTMGSGCSVGTICSTAGIIDFENSEVETDIYPNPFSTQTDFRTERVLKNASLTVCNSFGQTVKRVDNLSGQTIRFHRENLPSGLYFIRLTQDGKVLATDKLIITD